MITVIKRDSSEVQYDIDKIAAAITGAFNDLGRDFTDTQVLDTVEDKIRDDGRKAISVEEIQDMVEDSLMENGYFDEAKIYVRYRYKRELVRKSNTTDTAIKELLDGNNEYWNTENSNKNAKVAHTQRDYIAGITCTDITRRFLLPKEITEAHDAGILHFHDADYFAQNAIHNCLSRNTKFITIEGMRSFEDFQDGDIIEVLSDDGKYHKAIVRNYGVQKVYDYTFYNGKKEFTHTVRATANHRWYLKDGSITTSLAIGDKLKKAPVIYSQNLDWDNLTHEEQRMWCMGFGLGDGTVEFKGAGRHLNSTRIRLCGKKDLQFINRFNIDGCKIRDTHYENGDKDVVIYEYHKEIPSFNSLKELQCFINGLYCADGRTKTGKTGKINFGLQSSKQEVIDFLRDKAGTAGLYITRENERTGEITQFTSEAGRPYTILFSFNPDFNFTYTVLDKQEAGEEEVWCLEVEDTHNFVLEYGILTGNCELVDLADMLENGTMINDVMIEQPHRIITAATIATQIITAVTSSSYGGCTITLTHLAPFVRRSWNRYYAKYIDWGFDEEWAREFADRDTKKEVADAVQTFNYQCNSMTNTNGQSPFLSVNMYLGETEEYKPELAMLIEEFLHQRILGFKNKKGIYVAPAFPKLLYVLEEDNAHPNSPYYYLTELAAECTAKRMVPDYISEKVMKQLKIDQNGDGQCYPCMGCRSFLTPYVDENGKAKYYGRFNQGVVTINLADVALSAQGDMDKFWEIFDERLELCHRALQIRHERLAGVTSDVAPILWQHGAFTRMNPGESIHPYLHNGYSTLSLGYAGLYECVKVMTGKSHTDGGEGHDFGIAVMQMLNDKCAAWKADEAIDYSVYGTPIESVTLKFAKGLQNRFGVIEGITDRDYITNSYHVPVFEEIDAFEKLSIESEFQALSPGGAISYIEAPDMKNNIPAILEVISFIYDNIMYAEINLAIDYCMKCGYDGDMQIDDDMNWYCPNCGNRDQREMNVTRRTCGYIGSHYWNKGRTQEIKERVKHLDDKEFV